MNGTGKGGIRVEPGGGLVANANTLVSLSIRNVSGSSILQSVQYGSSSVPVHQNSFTLRILAGIQQLTLTVIRPHPGTSELLDSNGHLLAQFDLTSASFQIRGI
jgi:hypothetical protein